MSAERLENDVLALLSRLRDAQHSVPQRVYNLGGSAAYLQHLLEGADPGSLDLARLSELQDELSQKLSQAIEEDPYVREDESWADCSSLLNHLSQFSGRPWRKEPPGNLELLALVTDVICSDQPWDDRMAVLDAHPILGNYNRSSDLFRALEYDHSDEVAAYMSRLHRVLGKRKTLPRTHWWLTQAPDWVKDWTRAHPKG